MGCDIHTHLEVKLRGQWHHYSAGRMLRSYSTFEKMAGVRGHVKNAISPPKGLPEDATFLTKIDSERWGHDGHTHSWLSASEIMELVKWRQATHQSSPWWLEEEIGFLFGNCIADHLRYPEENDVGVEDVRLVFWFDN